MTHPSTRMALVLSPGDGIAEGLEAPLQSLGYHVRFTRMADEASAILGEEGVSLFFIEADLSVSTFDLPPPELLESTHCILVRKENRPAANERAFLLGILDFIRAPFTEKQILQILDRMTERKKDPVTAILHVITNVTGVQMGERQKTLVKTRLVRRMREVGYRSEADYMNYLFANRARELPALVSLMTTHTTDWFREPSHFDWLQDKFLPKAVKPGKPLRIWSAACSTGQEVYSIAIAVLEYFRRNGISPSTPSELKIIATDIDAKSLQYAKNGVYEADEIRKLKPDLVERYFDRGTGDLSGYYRVKDELWKICEFQELNLLSPSYALPEFQCIFARNVFIYFNQEQIVDITGRFLKHLSINGRLFIGRSESLTGMAVRFRHIGDSIYVPVSDRKEESEHPTRVFIIDDSSTIRSVLRRVLTLDRGFLVVGEAENPIQADEALKTIKADVITLDIHMPEMDGVTYLSKLRQKPHPPIVMVSSVNEREAIDVFKCFELGAVDYIQKPSNLDLETHGDRIREVLKTAAAVKPQSPLGHMRLRAEAAINYTPGAMRDLILIGASTGGVEAIRNVLRQFPANSPPVVIVQHIPPLFSRVFAERLNDVSKIKAIEAKGGEVLTEGFAYVAPGGKQLGLVMNGNTASIQITDDAPVNRHKPSVDYLFNTAAAYCGKYRIVAALMTGMGDDGARGLLKLRKAGAHTLAQDEATCTVYGMPKVAADLGAAVEVVPLQSIAYHLFMALKDKKKLAA